MGELFDESSIIPKSYLSLGKQAKTTREKKIKDVLYHKKLPQIGWDDMTIEHFINELSLLDSNNFLHNVGVGEREGRIFSNIVARRHFRMSHGIGRSGDVKAVQPKAAGSSLLNALANALVLDAIKLSGVKGCKNCFIVPTATGMALTLCLLYFRRVRPNARFVIWSRIDQKSCFKCISTAGFQPFVVRLQLNGDELSTDLSAVENAVEKLGHENVACIFTTTSCFAPRIPDNVIGISKLCKKYNIPHLVNNAYGLQCSSICNKIEEAARTGRIDAFVQSTDKNFMVPVGGAIVAGFDFDLIDAISQSYPGRASASSSMDILITLLSMGVNGYEKLRKDRSLTFEYFQTKIGVWCEEFCETLLKTNKNPISLAISLSSLESRKTSQNNESFVTQLGSMLFTRQCSGSRVVVKGEKKSIEGVEFLGWMSHCDNYPVSYLNVAAAIGIENNDVDNFIRILTDCYKTLMCKAEKE